MCMFCLSKKKQILVPFLLTCEKSQVNDIKLDVLIRWSDHSIDVLYEFHALCEMIG